MTYAQVGTFKKVTGSNGGTSSSMDTTGATLLVCGIAAPGGSVFTISDSYGNTWHLADTVNSQSEEVWYAWNPTVGPGHTFTVTGTSIFCLAYFTAWSGAKTSADPLDQHVTITGTGFTDPANPGAITPTEDGELCYLPWKDLGVSTVTGYTVIDTDAGAGGDHVGGGNAFNIQTTATTTNPNMNGVSTGFGDIVFVSFKAAPSGASTIIHGDETRQTNKANGIAGTSTPAGTINNSRSVTKSTPGAITPSGVEVEQTNKNVAGAIVPTGSLTSSKTYTKALSGSITPSGSETRQTNKLVAGSCTPTGSEAESTSHFTSGAIVPAGTESEQTNKTLAGALTPSGSLTAQTSHVVTLTGSITPTGALTATKIPGSNVYDQDVSGSLTPTGAETRQTNKVTSGSETASGDPSNTVTKPLAGTSTPTGSITRSAAKALTGSIGSASTVTRQVAKSLLGAILPTGSETRLTSRTLTGSVAPSGTLVRLLSHALAGTLGPQGSIVRQVGKATTGSLGPSSAQSHLVGKGLGGSLDPTGGLTTQTAGEVTLTGSIAPESSLHFLVTHGLASTVTTSGAETRLTSKRTSGTLAPSGDIDTTSSQSVALSGSLLPTSSLHVLVTHSFAGTISPFSVLRIPTTLALTGEIVPFGDLTATFVLHTQHSGSASLTVTSSSARLRLSTIGTELVVSQSSATVEVT